MFTFFCYFAIFSVIKEKVNTGQEFKQNEGKELIIFERSRKTERVDTESGTGMAD